MNKDHIITPEELRKLGLFLAEGIEEGWIPLYDCYKGCQMRTMWLDPFVDQEHDRGHNINDKIKVTKKGKIKITKIGYFFDCQK